MTAPGEFYAVGSITGYSGDVTVKVYVDYKALWRFDFGISTARVESGWTGVTVNAKGGTKTADILGVAYTAEKGYGFMNGSAVIEGRTEEFTQSGILPYLVYTDFALIIRPSLPMCLTEPIRVNLLPLPPQVIAKLR